MKNKPKIRLKVLTGFIAVIIAIWVSMPGTALSETQTADALVGVWSNIWRALYRTLLQDISMAKAQCLSAQYLGGHRRHRWRCAKGHEWESAPATMRHAGTWCPYCAGKMKLTIEEMQEIARSRGGECLSKMYINGSTKLRWRCHLGHEWMAIPDNVKNNKSWCPACVNKHLGGNHKKTNEPPRSLLRGGSLRHCRELLLFSDWKLRHKQRLYLFC